MKIVLLSGKHYGLEYTNHLQARCSVLLGFKRIWLLDLHQSSGTFGYMLNILKVEKTVGSRQLIHIRGVPDPSRCTTGECPQTNHVEKPMYERFFHAHARNISYFRTAKNNEMYGISQVKKKKNQLLMEHN